MAKSIAFAGPGADFDGELVLSAAMEHHPQKENEARAPKSRASFSLRVES